MRTFLLFLILCKSSWAMSEGDDLHVVIPSRTRTRCCEVQIWQTALRELYPEQQAIQLKLLEDQIRLNHLQTARTFFDHFRDVKGLLRPNLLFKYYALRGLFYLRSYQCDYDCGRKGNPMILAQESFEQAEWLSGCVPNHQKLPIYVYLATISILDPAQKSKAIPLLKRCLENVPNKLSPEYILLKFCLGHWYIKMGFLKNGLTTFRILSKRITKAHAQGTFIFDALRDKKLLREAQRNLQ